MHELFIQFADYFLQYGYIGIFLLMAVESSIIPLPSEVVMIPAGYLVAAGKMDATTAILAGGLGSLAGALVNYYLAATIGYKFIIKYGKYFLIKEAYIKKTQEFFDKYGFISTFTGRFIPLIRHYISLPAGMVKMNLPKFMFATLTGATIWCAILVWVGYVLRKSLETSDYVTKITSWTLLIVLAFAIIYVKFKLKSTKKDKRNGK